MRQYCLILIILFSFAKTNAQTQSDGQLWLDAELNYVYKLRYAFQDEISVKTLLFGGKEWVSFDNTPAFEYNVNPYLDLVSAVPLSYAIQDDFNSFEVRVMLGARAYLTPYKRPQFRILTRFENRWYYESDTKSWDESNRFRIRGELIYPINKDIMNTDNLWYGITDAEIFLSTSSDVSERFANRTRFRVGAGYRLNYKMRFEALYSLQFSRNTIDDDFNSVSNILRLRFKYYFD